MEDRKIVDRCLVITSHIMLMREVDRIQLGSMNMLNRHHKFVHAVLACAYRHTAAKSIVPAIRADARQQSYSHSTCLGLVYSRLTSHSHLKTLGILTFTVFLKVMRVMNGQWRRGIYCAGTPSP
ncbi:hypothetical protein FPOAC2_11260 [Fusarium poae]